MLQTGALPLGYVTLFKLYAELKKVLKNNIVPYMRRQRKLSNGCEQLVAGFELLASLRKKKVIQHGIHLPL